MTETAFRAVLITFFDKEGNALFTQRITFRSRQKISKTDGYISNKELKEFVRTELLDELNKHYIPKYATHATVFFGTEKTKIRLGYLTTVKELLNKGDNDD